MAFDMLLENLLIPFGQSLLYDLSKRALSDATKNIRIERLLYKAIRNGVNSVIKHKDLASAVYNTIIDSCKENEKPDVLKIVQREFNQWNYVNTKPNIAAAEICNKISEYIIAESDLCEMFTAETLHDLLNDFKDLHTIIQENHNDLLEKIENIAESNKATNILLHEIVQQIQDTTNNIIQIESNSRYIFDEYKNYFLNPLFLEKTMTDGKVVLLKDVYIENKYCILDFPFHNKNKEYSGLIEFIKNFILGNLLSNNYSTPYITDSKHIRVLFVKGHPGSGKSSLFYYLAYLKSYDELFFPNYQFYFVKLIEVFDATNGNLTLNNPLKDIEDYLGHKISFSNKTVLVLDGLDEICVAKNIDINDYCSNLIRIATSKNYKLRLIITTRLNYINIRNEHNKNVINMQLLNLSISDLRNWTEKYFNIHKTLSQEKKVAEKNINYIDEHKSENLMDIFAIPLLFYMIVASKIDISKINSIGHLYDQVFKELKERNYNEFDEDFKQKHGVNSKIPEDLARQIAIEISYKMYKSNKLLLKINSNEFDGALEKAYSSIRHLKSSDKEDIELLFPITFFYKKSIDVVEFAHKSIMEFFTAEKLYQELDKFNGELSNYIKKYMVNPIIITNEVLNFLTYFVNSRLDSKEIINQYSNVLSELKTELITKSDYQNKNVVYSFETSKIVFKLYWYFIREIIKCDLQDINDFLNEDIVRKYITGALSINDSKSIPFLDNNIICLDFSNLYFKEYDFAFCNLSQINLLNFRICNCNFSFSDLSNADMTNVSTSGSINFSFCNLSFVSFKNLKFLENKKQNDDMSQIVFTGCAFDNAVFENTDISYINFLSTVSMKQVKFKNIKMTLTQLVDFSQFTIIVDKIVVILRKEDFTSKDLDDIKNHKADSQKAYAVELATSKLCNCGLNHTIDKVSFIVKLKL